MHAKFLCNLQHVLDRSKCSKIGGEKEPLCPRLEQEGGFYSYLNFTFFTWGQSPSSPNSNTVTAKKAS